MSSGGKEMKKIAFLTSGGDAPGMNAALRAGVRSALMHGYTTCGVTGGYDGLLEGLFIPMESRSVSNIIQRGGTILRTGRSDLFRTEPGLQKAAETLSQAEVDALVVIGGNGSFLGAVELSRFWKGQLIGIPATIDNDLYGIDETIGFDTAVNTAVEAADKIRDTAEAHEQIFLLEVMGRDSGFIALDTAIASGAEEVALPELLFDKEAVRERLLAKRAKGKSSCLIVIAEGANRDHSLSVEEINQSKSAFRIVVLGHLQRGGSPTARDRILATQLGTYAVEAIHRGHTLVMAGILKGEKLLTPLHTAATEKKRLNSDLLELLSILST